MSQYIYFSHTCSIKIWGLTTEDRTGKVLKGRDICIIKTGIDSLQESDSVLILRGDYLYDDRLIKYLAETPNIILHLEDGQQETVVAAHVPGQLAIQAVALIENQEKVSDFHGLLIQTPTTIAVSFEKKLRKFEPPFVLPINELTKQALERRLFDWSYKGITDLVTKWAWPRPARWAVGQCVRFQLRPNHVTLVGLFLVIIAGICFNYGYYGCGLLAGWLMTFLDTVDGKLARVTVTSSKFGHYFDHLIDLIHPPIWYILWGLGLSSVQLAGLGFSLNTLFYSIIIAYVAGRLVEGSFKWFLNADFGIFCWQPIDSYFRLITARRNPNMIFLTISFFMGSPDLGLLAVTFWTVATSFFLLARFILAGYARFSLGSLRSWLADADQPVYKDSLAARIFTQHVTK